MCVKGGVGNLKPGMYEIGCMKRCVWERSRGAKPRSEAKERSPCATQMGLNEAGGSEAFGFDAFGVGDEGYQEVGEWEVREGCEVGDG